MLTDWLYLFTLLQVAFVYIHVTLPAFKAFIALTFSGPIITLAVLSTTVCTIFNLVASLKVSWIAEISTQTMALIATFLVATKMMTSIGVETFVNVLLTILSSVAIFAKALAHMAISIHTLTVSAAN